MILVFSKTSLETTDNLLHAVVFLENVLCSAHNGIVEIWDKEAYENAVNMDSDDFGLLAEEVMGGINPSQNELP